MRTAKVGVLLLVIACSFVGCAHTAPPASSQFTVRSATFAPGAGLDDMRTIRAKSAGYVAVSPQQSR
jgi:hypothetical protein